jgi:hypothetical protein
MLEAVSLTPGDRILFLTVPKLDLLEEVSAAVSRGLVSAVGARDDVYDARRSAGHLENVMFTPAEPAEIPWQENFFSWIIDTAGGWEMDRVAAREIHRVLAPLGHTWLANLDVAPLLELGLLQVGSGAHYRLLQKPGTPERPRANGHFPIV